MTKLIVLFATAAVPGFAQPAGPPRAEFEVASVKLNDGTTRGSSLRTPLGSLDAKNVILKLLISDAYSVEGFQISGGPAWLGSDHYDIEAKAAGGATRKQMMPMLQALLEDRFKLKVHRETKEGAVLELAVAKGGSKLRLLQEGSCVAADPNSPPRPPAPGGKPPCGVMRQGLNSANRSLTIDVVGASMATLTRLLTLMLGRPVYDKTGIAGPLDGFHLEYVREDMSGDAAAGPSIFTALQEQLGLKLEAAKGQVDVLVIDHVERPGEN